MPGITRVIADTAGGQIVSTPNNNFARVEGNFWAQKGAAIANHAPGGPHNGATINQGSSFARINGLQACFAGNTATCGDVATGSNVFRISN